VYSTVPIIYKDKEYIFFSSLSSFLLFLLSPRRRDITNLSVVMPGGPCAWYLCLTEHSWLSWSLLLVLSLVDVVIDFVVMYCICIVLYFTLWYIHKVLCMYTLYSTVDLSARGYSTTPSRASICTFCIIQHTCTVHIKRQKRSFTPSHTITSIGKHFRTLPATAQPGPATRVRGRAETPPRHVQDTSPSHLPLPDILIGARSQHLCRATVQYIQDGSNTIL
jgi:hypothetical protein